MPDGSKPIYLKREELVGKSVIAADASIFGTVEDLVATADGKIGISITLRNPLDTMANTIVGSDAIQAMGDVILLKPNRNTVFTGLQPAPPPSTNYALTRSCNRCGHANSATSHFCIKCGLKLE